MARGEGNRPWYPWYPGDLKRDSAVQACPFLVRAIWREMLDLMHDGDPYGHLTAGGVPFSEAELAGAIGGGVTEEQVRAAWAILEARKVFSRDDNGVIYSRRMVRDERLRQVGRDGGKESTGPTYQAKRSGGPGQLFNFLVAQFGGCLACGEKRREILELHRIVPGRHGGKYRPGNVVVVCPTCHALMAAGQLTPSGLLTRIGVQSLDALFVGYRGGVDSIPPSIPPGGNDAIPSSTPPQSAECREHKEHVQPSAVPSPNGSGLRVESLPAKKPKKKTNPDIRRFIDWWVEAFASHLHGAKYGVQGVEDATRVKRLLGIYGLDRLKQLAVVILTTDDQWIAGTDRSLTILAKKANWAEGKLAAYEAKFGPVEIPA